MLHNSAPWAAFLHQASRVCLPAHAVWVPDLVHSEVPALLFLSSMLYMSCSLMRWMLAEVQSR